MASDIKQLNPERERFIEDVGIFFVDMHLPKIAGKILGYLLVCSPPHQTAGEIAAATGGSKGSISTMTRFLIQHDFIERLGITGKRDSYYQIKPNSSAQWLQMRMSFLRRLHDLADRALQLSSKEDPKQLQWLEEVHDLNAFMEREMPLLMERWIAKIKNNNEVQTKDNAL